jgi:hypothetical protein
VKCKKCDRNVWAKGLCNLHYGEQWRKDNPERAAEIYKRYLPKAYKNSKRWRKNNPEKAKAYSREYHKKNKEYIKERVRKKREKFKCVVPEGYMLTRDAIKIMGCTRQYLHQLKPRVKHLRLHHANNTGSLGKMVWWWKDITEAVKNRAKDKGGK